MQDHTTDRPEYSDEDYPLTTEEQHFVERIINLLCFISLGFFLLFIYLSVPTFQLILSGNGDLFLILNIITPLLHQAAGTWLFWKRATPGWYLLYTFLLTSALFGLLGLISSLSYSLSGKYILNYMTGLPVGYYVIYLAIYAVLAIFFFRKKLMWYYNVNPGGIRIWSLLSVLLFLLYLLPFFLI